MDSLARVERDVVACERCPRLRRWCRDVATTKVRRFADQDYWGRPVPGFGDPAARLLIVGLAPAAHGANRTGRLFTGDRSGDFLFAALHRVGVASQAESVHRDDGLALRGVWISPLVRCAPPANKPAPEEIAACRDYLARELALLAGVGTVLALGGIAWRGFLDVARERGEWTGTLPRFAHGAQAEVGPRRLLGSYHPSQQNTFTGRLTPAMLDAVLTNALSDA